MLALAQSALASFYDQIGVLGEQVSIFTKIGITATGLYLASIGAVMQLFPNLGAKKVTDMTKPSRSTPMAAPKCLRYEEVEAKRPGKGEALIRHTAIGLNFIDIYYRSGLYPPPAGLPLIPGNEARAW